MISPPKCFKRNTATISALKKVRKSEVIHTYKYVKEKKTMKNCGEKSNYPKIVHYVANLPDKSK